ncbi:MAG: oxygenase MpaB family protein [Bacteroidales bacterium]
MYRDRMTVAERINGERVVVLGWGRAILLQVAHPLVAAGVADHSNFAAGPLARLGRLHATIGAMRRLTFRGERAALDTAARINAIHDRVNGTLRDGGGPYAPGTAYTATDPELLLWVHATLLDSMPRAYEQFVAPLSPAARDDYVRESMAAGRLFRIPERMLPSNREALDRYLQEMLASGPIHVTATARRIARALLYPPLLDPTRPLAWLVRLVTLGLLPTDIRSAYGFRWTPGHDRVLRAFSALCRGVRPLLPAVLTRWPETR